MNVTLGALSASSTRVKIKLPKYIQCRRQRNLGRVFRKPVNANPGLKVNRVNNFSCIKVLSIAQLLCSLRLLMLKTEEKKYK